MNLFIKLKNLNALTTSEQALVDYIIHHPKDVIQFSPKELSEHSYVSISTIYRLINKLNLDGLNDLKFVLATSINSSADTDPLLNIDYPISSEDNQYQITQKLKAVYEQTIESTIEINTIESMNIHNQLLLEANYIDIYASSANIYFAQNFQFQMQEIGERISVPIDDYMQNLTASNSTPEHLAIVVSYEGRGSSVKKILKILNKNNSKILLITAQNSPLLNEAVTSIFLLPSLENHYNKISSFSTRTSLMYTFDNLYLNYFNQRYRENIAYKLSGYKRMNPNLR